MKYPLSLGSYRAYPVSPYHSRYSCCSSCSSGDLVHSRTLYSGACLLDHFYFAVDIRRTSMSKDTRDRIIITAVFILIVLAFAYFSTTSTYRAWVFPRHHPGFPQITPIPTPRP